MERKTLVDLVEERLKDASAAVAACASTPQPLSKAQQLKLAGLVAAHSALVDDLRVSNERAGLKSSNGSA